MALHKKSGTKRRNLHARKNEQDAPQPHDQPATRRGRNKRKSAAPQHMRRSGMAR